MMKIVEKIGPVDCGLILEDDRNLNCIILDFKRGEVP